MADPYDAISAPVAAPTAAATDPYAAVSSPAAAAAPPVDDAAVQAQGAREAAASHMRQVQQPTRGRQQPTTTGDVVRGVRDLGVQAASGFNQGVGPLLNAPQDAFDAVGGKAMDVLGIPKSTQPGIHERYNESFVNANGPPKNDFQRITRAGGEMAGENLPLSAIGVGSAAAFPRLAWESTAPVAGNIWQTLMAGGRNLADTWARNPAKALVGDTVGAAEAGSGGEMWKQKAQDAGAGPKGQHSAELAGQIAVPTATAAYAKYGPSGMIRAGTSKLVDTVLKNVPQEMLPAALRPAGSMAERQAERLSFGNNEGKYAPNEGVNGVPMKDLPVQPPKEPGFAARKLDEGAQRRADEATSIVAKDMGKITSRPGTAENLSEANRLKAEIPGFEPGIAKATADPALLNKEANFDAKATNDELRGRQDAYDAQHGAIRKYVDETVPAAGENPQDRVAETSKGRIQAEQTDLGAQADAVQGQIKKDIESLPNAERADSGAKFRDIHEKAEGASSDRTSELRKAIANPKTPIQVGDKTMTIDEALDRRAAINQEQRKYASTVGTVEGADRMAQLSAERSTLDKAIEGVNEPGMKEYRDYYRYEHVPKYQEGAGRNVVRYDRFGYDKNKIPDEKVLAQFGGSNNISAAKQFTATHGENPEAVQLMVDHQLGRLKATAIDGDGVVKPDAVDKFLANNRELLDALPPAVREGIAAKNPAALHQKLGELEQRQRAAAESKLGQLAKNGNPEAHIQAGINDWQVMRDLKRSMHGDPQAEAALKRAVWDHVLGVAGAEGPIKVDAIRKILLPEQQGGNRRALAQVLDAQHLNRLENAVSATNIANRLDRPTGTFEKPTTVISKFEDAIGTSVPSLGATASALARGRSSPVFEVPRLVGNAWKGLSEKQINAVWKEALSNPEVAKQLAVVGKGGVATPRQLDRMRNYTLTLGIHNFASKDEN